MYEEIELPKSPKLARLLLPFAEIGGLDFSQDMIALASKDLILKETLSEFPLRTTALDLTVLQHVDDREGRCIVLQGTHVAMSLLIARVWLKNLFPLLIVTKNTTAIRWKLDLKNAFPNKTIFNSFDDKDFNINADIFITSSSDVYKTEMMKRKRFKQAYVDDLIIGSLLSNNHEILFNLAMETFSTTVILRLRNIMPKNSETNNLTDSQLFERFDSEAISSSYAYDVFKTILFPHSTYGQAILGEYERIDLHMKKNGYDIEDKQKFLLMLNICAGLVSGQ